VDDEQIKANIITDIINNPEESQPSSVFVGASKYIDTLRLPKSYHWNPLEDITTYELALCVPILGMQSAVCVEYAVNRLPDNAKRHFKEC
jgi:hypothetical protein